MRTVKLVIIGNSGVGKTSLRSQYVSGHFSTGYRSTIGADFIAKTLPHHSNPEESVTLQIWDTAGQERFSSLSSAFFRGADAAILIFDVNQPETLRALHRWWSEFCTRAPLSEEEMEEYCLVVVGNKTDLVPGSPGSAAAEGGAPVSEVAALHFIDELVPPSESSSNSSPTTPADERDWMHSDAAQPGDIILVDETNPAISIHARAAPRDADEDEEEESSTPTLMVPPHTPSIDLHTRHHKHASNKARSYASQYSTLAPATATLSSTHTSFASFHTPTSSFSDTHEQPYHSALSSPLSRSRSRSPSSSPSLYLHRSYRSLSTSTMSTSSAPTITPARYASRHALAHAAPPRPPRGPKLLFTSAKTGAGVSDVFAYVARRVVMRWEWEEAHLGAPDLVGNGSAVHLGDAVDGNKRAFLRTCCSS